VRSIQIWTEEGEGDGKAEGDFRWAYQSDDFSGGVGSGGPIVEQGNSDGYGVQDHANKVKGSVELVQIGAGDENRD